MSRIRQREIHARRTRKRKLNQLRVRYSDAKGPLQKEQVMAKLGRVAPWLNEEALTGKKKKEA
jgi:hypothetical protein